VQAALRRQPVDRVPVFMWFHPQTSARLGALLEIPASSVALAMGDDIRQTWVNNNYAMEGIVHEHEGEGHVDLWGVGWVKRDAFNQIAGFPLAGATREEVLAYRFPREHFEFLMDRMSPLMEQAAGYYLGCDVSPCVFEMYWRLRGMEQTMLEMASEPELTEEMFRRSADFAVELSEMACDRFPLDWLWTGDDVAGQGGLLFSPRTWRAMVKPHLARVFAVGKRRGLPVAYHCCGALRPLIPDLIEIGMDVLNPVQCNCPGMDPIGLKRDFGSQIAFMGGVDTQHLLPFATAGEVRAATERLIEGMTSDGGGYILAASHTVPPETPDANIFAMYEAAGITKEAIFDRAAELRAQIKMVPSDLSSS
jgi:uroporphyrinogen decarboxylase